MAPGTVRSARPLAVFRMTDRGRCDDKVVCSSSTQTPTGRVRRLSATSVAQSNPMHLLHDRPPSIVSRAMAEL
jgi:hypothetical protein